MKILRTFLNLCSSAFICGCLSPAWAQCPPRTTVAETLFNADGTLAEGRIVIAWPTFAIGACQVPAGQATVNVSAGALSVQLYPNTAAVPAGTSYRVTYYLKSGRVTTEYWVVPVSGAPVGLAAVRSATVPVPNVMFSQSQVTNLGADLAGKIELPSPCVAGKFLQSNGSPSPPQVNCVNGTGGGGTGTVSSVGLSLPAQFTVSGSPVTTSGTLSAAWLNQNASLFLAGPESGGAGAPAFRAIVTADLPSLDAAKINTGSFPDARVDDTITLTNLTQVSNRSYSDLQNIPSTFAPAAHALVGSAHTVSGLTADHYLKAFSGTTFGFAQIAFSDLGGSIAAVQQNNPAVGAKGGVEAKTCSGTDKLSAIGTDGIPVCSTDQTGGGSSHEMLSATHTDTTTATASRGALIVGKTATPKWELLALGAANRVLASDGTDAAWSTVPDAALASNYSGTGACTNQFVRGVNDNAAPTCAAVSLTADVSGVLPLTNVAPVPAVFAILNPVASAYSPADGATDYITLPAVFTNNTTNRSWLAPFALTITAVRIQTNCGTPGSAQSITFTLNVNNSDTSLTGTGTWDAAETTQLLTGSVSVSSGDRIAVKITNPNYATNPASCRPIATLAGTIP